MLVNRLREYAPSNALEQENALQETMQQIILASLARAKFFSHAGFHGGTCLRILYGMNRFSEDLDFVLKAPDRRFQYEPYLDRLRHDSEAEGLHLEVSHRGRREAAVRKVFLKTDSIGRILSLDLPYESHSRKRIRIKLEIDTNPPGGASYETRYMTFPVTTAITTMDLASGFGSKSHALLCRDYTKGRDWYDFLWYVSKGVIPNLKLLANALDQIGPWAGGRPEVSREWYLAALGERIEAIDWDAARRDVERFVMSREQASLELWSRDLFLQQLEGLGEKWRQGGESP
jgi:predicted nucleotidyltransferase component of viral defense system